MQNNPQRQLQNEGKQLQKTKKVWKETINKKQLSEINYSFFKNWSEKDKTTRKKQKTTKIKLQNDKHRDAKNDWHDIKLKILQRHIKTTGKENKHRHKTTKIRYEMT